MRRIEHEHEEEEEEEQGEACFYGRLLMVPLTARWCPQNNFRRETCLVIFSFAVFAESIPFLYFRISRYIPSYVCYF